MAAQIASYSPDAVIVTRQGLREAWEVGSVQRASLRVVEEYLGRLQQGENFGIGVDAFARKVKPGWVPSKL